MKLSKIIIGVIMLVVLITIFKGINDSNSEDTNPQDINSETSILTPDISSDPIKDDLKDFPIPQSTTEKKLLTNKLVPINTDSTNKIPYETIHEVRNSNDIKHGYLPKYFLKDNLSPNTIGTGEYKFAEVNNNKSSAAWSDENVSQYPNYYTSEIKNELTNIGGFYDNNNHYNDINSQKSINDSNDICRIDANGKKYCLDNKRLQNIPPSLINDLNNCGFMNNIGLLNVVSKKNNENSILNGGNFYHGVTGNNIINNYSKPLKESILKCFI
jgi:hypothetical protein